MKSAVAVCTVIMLTCLLQKTEAITPIDDMFVMSGNLENRTYNPMPKSVWDPAIKKDWVKMKMEDSFCYDLELYCPRDSPIVCIFFDKLGRRKGAQIAFPEEAIANVDRRLFNVTASRNIIKVVIFEWTMYAIRVYYVNPESETNDDTSESVNGLWTQLDGEMVKIERCQPNSPKMGDFDLQGCYPGLGIFYVYKFNRYSSCKTEFPLFMLYEEGNLVGYGYGLPACDPDVLPRNLYYHPNREEMQQDVPDPPPCFKAAGRASGYNYMSIKVLLVQRPWTIRCPECSF